MESGNVSPATLGKGEAVANVAADCARQGSVSGDRDVCVITGTAPAALDPTSIRSGLCDGCLRKNGVLGGTKGHCGSCM